MRGRRRVLTAAVLLCTLIIGALSVAVASRFFLSRWSVSSSVVAVAVLTGVALDLSPLRPLDIGRQVPQWWGHRYGAVAAAARYGLRLGVGPATILTSWTWWSGFLGGALFSVRVAVVGALTFAAARFATMVAIAWGSPSGAAMAERVSRWSRRSNSVRYGGLALLSAVAAVCV